MMEMKLDRLGQYLKNSQRLFQALQDDDLEAINQCLDKNLILMKEYDGAEFICAGSGENSHLRAKMEAVMQANQRCLLFTENRCRSLRDEIENTDRNRNGIIRYGKQRTHSARFIDRKT